MHVYSGTSLIWTLLGQKKVSQLLVRCPDFRGCSVHKQGVWDSQMCPIHQGVLISGCLGIHVPGSTLSNQDTLGIEESVLISEVS